MKTALDQIVNHFFTEYIKDYYPVMKDLDLKKLSTNNDITNLCQTAIELEEIAKFIAYNYLVKWDEIMAEEALTFFSPKDSILDNGQKLRKNLLLEINKKIRQFAEKHNTIQYKLNNIDISNESLVANVLIELFYSYLPSFGENTLELGAKFMVHQRENVDLN